MDDEDQTTEGMSYYEERNNTGPWWGFPLGLLAFGALFGIYYLAQSTGHAHTAQVLIAAGVGSGLTYYICTRP